MTFHTTAGGGRGNLFSGGDKNSQKYEYYPRCRLAACSGIADKGTAAATAGETRSKRFPEMTFTINFVRHGLAPLVIVLLSAAASAQSFERPPTFNVAQIPGIKRVGTNYTVQNPVHSDGILRVYVLTTPYGKFTVTGDEMLRMRTHELDALAKLEKVSESEHFGRALAEAGISPLKFAGQLVANPVGTVQNTFAGVGAFFNRLGAGINHAGQTPGDPVSDFIGVTDERRKIATTYGVDPYTDFPPLSAKLNQLSQAATAGGLIVTGALLFVPGAAGIVVSNLSTANKVNDIGIADLARDYTAAQIIDINQAALTTMRVPPGLSAKLLANRHYTPIDMAAMVAALESMRGVRGRAVFVARAAAADGRAIAYTMRRMAEYMADDYRKGGGYVRFVSLADFPYVVTRDNRVTAVMPIDALSWTRETAGGFTAVSNDRQRSVPKARGQMRITGMATALAKKQLKAQGWTLLERQRP
jgi:hypothetical protein